MKDATMTTAQHTPGPWTLEPSGQGVRWNRAGYITSADGKVCVGYAYSDKTKMHVGEADANGVLMAAAPELLTACKASLELNYDGADPAEASDSLVDAEQKREDAHEAVCVALRAAIAKAEGKDAGQ